MIQRIIDHHAANAENLFDQPLGDNLARAFLRNQDAFFMANR